jgi:hypothetical protein
MLEVTFHVIWYDLIAAYVKFYAVLIIREAKQLPNTPWANFSYGRCGIKENFIKNI